MTMRMTGLMVLVTLTAASTAHADPTTSITMNGTTPLPQPDFYVGTNAATGLEPGGVAFFGGSIEGGERIHGPVWAHQEIILATGGELFGPAMNMASGRAGVELRVCIPEGWACGAGGVDLGGNYYSWRSDDMHLPQRADGLVIPRATVELGNKRVRVRPSLALPLSGQGWGLEMKLGLSVQW